MSNGDAKKTLHLTLKLKWFDMIASGEKKEEYRACKHYWHRRLCNYSSVVRSLENIFSKEKNQKPADDYFKKFDTVTFKNGYGKKAPVMVVECLGISTGKAKPEWSDNWQGNVFKIKLGAVISLKNYPPKCRTKKKKRIRPKKASIRANRK